MDDGCMDPLVDSNQQGAGTPANQTSPKDLDIDRVVLPALYFLMLPVAFLLNGVSGWVSLHIKASSNFVVYLKNLVAADVIMTIIIPFMAVKYLPGASNRIYILSCYLSPIFYSIRYTCIALLGLISLDRFFKIVKPQSKLFGQNLTLSKLISGLVWVIMLVGFALPNMILSNNSLGNITEINTCMLLKGSAGRTVHENIVICMNFFFWLVSLVIVVCYVCIANKVIQSFRKSGSNNNQGKQKIKLRVFLVVMVFFGSFGPYHIVRIPYTFQQVNSFSYSSCSFLSSKLAKDLSHWLASSNICLDPLLYVFLCREFKEKLNDMFKKIL
ncbi:P2Y purinoceptor 13-like [Pungitius pungitius]|uniref:P2Y purinoceptor 13-like n=1 Tax=Pungitius pungitius TaxID=134920 RepID=UPI002E15A61E